MGTKRSFSTMVIISREHFSPYLSIDETALSNGELYTILGTTITISRLKQRGYIPFLAYYLKNR
ncbi:MAG: hypothetical protein GY834_08070 [Bacteroidetes bacterium]|nr:hypothetical protein [Bacteroidota bacterium]